MTLPANLVSATGTGMNLQLTAYYHILGLLESLKH